MICPSCGHDNIEGMDHCENCIKPLRDLDIPRAEATGGVVRSVMQDDLSKLEREEPLTVNSDSPALDVVRQMKRARRACALVVDKGKLVGIFTEQDALQKLSGTSPANATISDVMSDKPETLQETDSVAAAINKMAISRSRYIPIAARDGNYAVVSVKQVLKYIAQGEW